MAKYKHIDETRVVLDDLENRVIQLSEVNSLYKGLHGEATDKMIDDQNQAFGSVLTLIRQVRDTGHVKRGTPVIPDDIEPMATTKWHGRQLGLSELMLATPTPHKSKEGIE